MIFCGKCKKPLNETETMMPTFLKCPNCKFEVYEVSDW